MENVTAADVAADAEHARQMAVLDGENLILEGRFQPAVVADASAAVDFRPIEASS